MNMSNELRYHPHTKSDGSWWEYDARGIPLARVCEQCRTAKLAGFRPDVLTDPNYVANEEIEPEESDDDYFQRTGEPRGAGADWAGRVYPDDFSDND